MLLVGIVRVVRRYVRFAWPHAYRCGSLRWHPAAALLRLLLRDGQIYATRAPPPRAERRVHTFGTYASASDRSWCRAVCRAYALPGGTGHDCRPSGSCPPAWPCVARYSRSFSARARKPIRPMMRRVLALSVFLWAFPYAPTNPRSLRDLRAHRRQVQGRLTVPSHSAGRSRVID